MELTDQVPLLEQAVALKQYGVVQKSLLYYVNVKNDGWRLHFAWGYEWNAVFCGYPKYSAYTLSELQHMITDPVVTSSWHVDIKHEAGKWKLYSTISNWTIAEFDSNVSAAAARVIYLIENKHIEVDQINKFLTRAAQIMPPAIEENLN